METKTIAGIQRLNNSVNGNPRFRFSFTDGAMLESMSDAMFSYAVGNSDMREGSLVQIELTRAGKIRSMAPAGKSHA